METIIYIGNFELPDKNAAAHRVLNNAKIFRKLDYNVVFVDTQKEISEFHFLKTRHHVHGFDCYSRKYPCGINWISHLVSIKNLNIILKEYNNVKMVIAYNYPAIALFRMRNHCHKRGIKFVADCTEWYSNCESESLLKGYIKAIDSYFRMNWIQKRLDGLILISTYLQKYYKNKSNLIVLPPLTDLSDEKWNLRDDNLDNTKINIVYCGVPGHQKDLITSVVEFLHQFDGRNRICFTVIGVTLDEYVRYHPEIKSQMKNLDGIICFRGRLPHIKCIATISSADFCLFVREKNRITEAGFPTKFVESISCGTPVMTTDTSDIKKYIQHGINGYLIDENVLHNMGEILSQDSESLKHIKTTVNKQIFDYHNYIEIVQEWLDYIFL